MRLQTFAKNDNRNRKINNLKSKKTIVVKTDEDYDKTVWKIIGFSR